MSELQGDMPWIVGLFGAIIFFAVFETKAFRFPRSTNTLSHVVYTIGANWPLSIFLMGMLAGGLAVHFFWHWCPPGSVSEGLLTLPIPDHAAALSITKCVQYLPNGFCNAWSTAQ